MSSNATNVSVVFNFTSPATSVQDGSYAAIPQQTPTVPSFVANTTGKSINQLLYNGTGYYIDDEVEPGLNDLQTVFLACFATLIPLVISLFTAFGIRILWTKYKRRKDGSSKYDGIGMLHQEGTSESIGKPLHAHLLNSDKHRSDTQLAINTDEVEVCEGTGVNSAQIRSGNHSSTNGSIITMTLKNNHLIVETEERNDIEEDSRETKMKYSPGARDGVFVVEVQQGVRRSPGGGGGAVTCAEPEASLSASDQCALVHNPPDRYSDEDTLEEGDDNDYYVETTSSTRETPDSIAHQVRTGLTRSVTSLCSAHRSYCYGSQQGYDTGVYGYPVYGGYVNDEPPRTLPPANKPKITAVVYKHPFNASVDLSPHDPLSSDPRRETGEEQQQARQANREHIARLRNDISIDVDGGPKEAATRGAGDIENGGLRLQGVALADRS